VRSRGGHGGLAQQQFFSPQNTEMQGQRDASAYRTPAGLTEFGENESVVPAGSKLSTTQFQQERQAE